MKVLLLLGLVSASLAATIREPETCTTFPCLIFEDEFDTLDHYVWEHEITASGGGNWEFQAYINNRSISYVRDSTLFIKPQLTSNWVNEEFLTSGTLNIWGSQGINDVCTGNSFYGCERVGTATNIINPILSARLRTLNNFAFRYGTVEIRAKLPRGDWLWPAIWMMPERWPYGTWPASGEIDIMESRGNDNYGTQDLDNRYAGSTLHWGPYFALNRFYLTTQSYTRPDLVSLADGFNTWKVEWTNTSLTFYLNDVLQLRLQPGVTWWEYGGFEAEADIHNPWENESNMAPFDTKFHFILNLAVGGTNGFFPDDQPGTTKPWNNADSDAFLRFYNAKDQWLPTWQQGEGQISEGAALQIDYIRVWKAESVEQ